MTFISTLIHIILILKRKTFLLKISILSTMPLPDHIIFLFILVCHFHPINMIWLGKKLRSIRTTLLSFFL
jgi:hypothetical protein